MKYPKNANPALMIRLKMSLKYQLNILKFNKHKVTSNRRSLIDAHENSNLLKSKMSNAFPTMDII